MHIENKNIHKNQNEVELQESKGATPDKEERVQMGQDEDINDINEDMQHVEDIDAILPEPQVIKEEVINNE